MLRRKFFCSVWGMGFVIGAVHGNGGFEHDPGFVLPVDPTPLVRDDPSYRTSYAPILADAQNAVVSVHTARVVRVVRSRGGDPRDEFIRRFFGLPPAPGDPATREIEERRVPSGIGSGVVISEDGYILTNNHVITQTRQDLLVDEILVRLNDGRELPATVVGRDPQTDIAVLKVDATALPFLRLARSEDLMVGDIVFAIGNPLGVGLTITKGIISATGRSNLAILGQDSFEDFIQTDASINQGNSGGALIDAQGRLIGINTAILSRTGGNIGIGFAIPSTLARNVSTALIRTGSVRRGVLGAETSDLTPDLAEAFGVDSLSGALISSILPDLPAEAAGLRNGDIIIEINGNPVRNSAMLRTLLSQIEPETEFPITVIREGERVAVTLALTPPEAERSRASELLPGVEVAVVDAAQRQAYDIPATVSGLVVVAVRDDSPFARSMREGMVIREINSRTVSNVQQARQLLASRPVSRVYIYEQGRSGFFALRP